MNTPSADLTDGIRSDDSAPTALSGETSLSGLIGQIVNGASAGQPIATPVVAFDRVSTSRSDASRKAALKLWEIWHKYHCPIIGTCLHVDELRRLADKVDGWAEAALSDYELHVSFVGAAETKNSASIAVQKRLDRKYASVVRQFSRAKTAEDIETLWRAAMAKGEVPGAFWALMSHPRADQGVRALAYEDVHMLSHQIGAGQYTEARVLAETRAQLARVEQDRAQEARRYEQRLAARDRLLAAHKDQLAKASAALRRLERADTQDAAAAPDPDESKRIAGLEADVQRLQDAYERAMRENDRLRDEHAAAHEQVRQLTADLADQQEASAALEKILADQQAANEETSDCPRDGRCGACLDLQGRRILCIGGRGTLADHYRELVTRCNGELVRHDGGLEDSHRRLESMMAAADAVVCPADFVSHNAYYRAKRFCKRYAKPCILLRSSGIASFARALEQLAA